MKRLNETAVKVIAEKKMKALGAVTTLEVKKALREAGYRAFQSEVSFYMDELCEEEGWIYEFNGQFRIYRKLTDLEILAHYMPRSDN